MSDPFDLELEESGPLELELGPVTFIPEASGGVTRDQLAAEGMRRRDGDELAEYDVSSGGAFAGVFQLHNDSNHASILTMTGTFTTSARSYTSGQRYYLAPHHNQESDMVLLSEPGGGGGGADATARAAAAAARQAAARNAERIAEGERPFDVVHFPRAFPAGGVAGNHALLIRTWNRDLMADPANINRISINVEGEEVHNAFFAEINVDDVLDYGISDPEAARIGDLGSAETVEYVITLYSGYRSSTDRGTVQAELRFNVPVGGDSNYPATRAELQAVADTIPTDTGGLNQDQVDARIQSTIAPFSTVELFPGGVVGTTIPTSIWVKFADKQRDKTITGIRMRMRGVTWTLNSATPVSNIEAGANAGGVLQFDTTRTNADSIGDNAPADDESVSAEFTFTYSDGTTERHNEPFLIRNPSFMAPAAPTSGLNEAQVTALIQGPARAGNNTRWPKDKLPTDTAYDADIPDVSGFQNAAQVKVIADRSAADTAGPVIILSTITSYDATQNRFEDSAGNEVVVPDGIIVALAETVYDEAVADSGFTPNANAIYIFTS